MTTKKVGLVLVALLMLIAGATVVSAEQTATPPQRNAIFAYFDSEAPFLVSGYYYYSDDCYFYYSLWMPKSTVKNHTVWLGVNEGSKWNVKRYEMMLGNEEGKRLRLPASTTEREMDLAVFLATLLTEDDGVLRHGRYRLPPRG